MNGFNLNYEQGMVVYNLSVGTISGLYQLKEEEEESISFDQLLGSMALDQQEPYSELQGCISIHTDQLQSNASTFGVENVELLDQDLKQLESNKVHDQRLNNCTEINHQNPDICRDVVDQILWHRIRWSDEMVKILITAVAYVREYVNISQENKNQKRGKWKAISYVMMKRGFLVSPQQCEDKFHDLNKKYRRLNEILGKGTACEVVKNHSLMDSMNLSDQTAEEVIKILNSKQLFYQEMCSYHCRNPLFLPHDENLAHSLCLALKGKEKNECKELVLETLCEKRKREEDDSKGGKLQNERWIRYRLQKLEEMRVELEEQRLELEKKRVKWLRYSQDEDWKLEKMSLENKFLKLQNKSLAFELKSHKLGSK